MGMSMPFLEPTRTCTCNTIISGTRSWGKHACTPKPSNAFNVRVDEPRPSWPSTSSPREGAHGAPGALENRACVFSRPEEIIIAPESHQQCKSYQYIMAKPLCLHLYTHAILALAVASSRPTSSVRYVALCVRGIMCTTCTVQYNSNSLAT